MQKIVRRGLASLLIFLSIAEGAVVAVPIAAAEELPSPGDPVLRWNAVAIQAVATDHTGTFGDPEQGGPTKTSRALGIVHGAIYDAVNSIDRTHEPYLTQAPIGEAAASVDSAVAYAAFTTLVALFPKQESVFDAALNEHLSVIADGPEKDIGAVVGRYIALKFLEARENDGSNVGMSYAPSDDPGKHRVDPLNFAQAFHGPLWGGVTPFFMESGSQFRAPLPPDIASPEYAVAYDEAKTYGGDGTVTETVRTAEQTEIGTYWGYDGTKNLGTPPRLYNQITRLIAGERGNSVAENARLFGLVNLAQADAGIAAWESKYVYNYWRPVIAIREADEGTGPTGLGDGNPATEGDTTWTPLGAPASNISNGGVNFTPPFPAYPSGHATFGAASFRSIANFYGTDDVPFTFTSDELNGVTTDNLGNVRPMAPHHFERLSDATVENAQSRIYLGIHWQFDATEGITMGTSIADYAFANAMRETALPAIVCDNEETEEEGVDCLEGDDNDLLASAVLPVSVQRGSTFGATFSARNAGPGAASDAALSVNLPEGISLNAMLSGSCTIEGFTLTCSGLTIDPKSTQSVSVELTVSESASCPSEVSFTPNVTPGDEKDYFLGNNTGNTQTLTIDCEPENDLGVSLSGPSQFPVGQILRYVARIANSGPATASSPRVSMDLPAGVTFSSDESSAGCAQNGTRIDCTVTPLLSGTSEDATFAFTPLATLPCGTELTFAAVASSSERELNASDNTSNEIRTTLTCAAPSGNADEAARRDRDQDTVGNSQSPGASRGKGTNEARFALAIVSRMNGMENTVTHTGHFRLAGNAATLANIGRGVASEQTVLIDGFTQAERNIICSMKRYMEKQDPRKRKTDAFRNWFLAEIARELHRTEEEIRTALGSETFCR